MALCSHNLSIAIDRPAKGYLTYPKNRIDGSVASFYNRMAHRSDRTCELMQCSNNNETCEVSPKNWLWDAKLRLAEMSFGTERLANALMEPSKTDDGYRFSQDFDEPTSFTKPDPPSPSFLFSNTAVVCYILFGYLLTYLAVLIFMRNVFVGYGPFRILQLVVFRTPFYDFNRLSLCSSRITFVFLLFNLLAFLTLTVLRTLINSPQRVRSTNRLVAMMSQDLQRLRRAPKNSMFQGMFNNKRPRKEKDTNQLSERGDEMSPFLMFMRFPLLFMSSISQYTQSRFYLLVPIGYLRALHCIFTRRSPENGKHRSVQQSFEDHFERGLLLNIYLRLNVRFIEILRLQNRFFDRLDEFLVDSSQTDDVLLEKNKNVFTFIFYFYLLVLILFFTRSFLQHFGFRARFKKLKQRTVKKLRAHIRSVRKFVKFYNNLPY